MPVGDLAKGMFFWEIFVDDVEEFPSQVSVDTGISSRVVPCDVTSSLSLSLSLSLPLPLSFFFFFFFFFQYYRRHRGPLKTLLTEPVKFDKEKKGAVKKL